MTALPGAVLLPSVIERYRNWFGVMKSIARRIELGDDGVEDGFDGNAREHGAGLSGLQQILTRAFRRAIPKARPFAVFLPIPRRMNPRVQGIMPVHDRPRLRREHANGSGGHGRGEMTEATVRADEQIALAEKRGHESEWFPQHPMLRESFGPPARAIENDDLVPYPFQCIGQFLPVFQRPVACRIGGERLDGDQPLAVAQMVFLDIVGNAIDIV